MTGAWYRVASLGFGYAGAAIALLTVLLALRRQLAERRLWRRVRRDLPQAGAAGALRVLSSKGRRFSAGEDIPLPYEGTLGSSRSCDVRIPRRGVHLRSAFFWVERDALHVAPLHRDGFEADGVPVEPGDEAVLRDGAVLRVGDLKTVLHLSRAALHADTGADGSYVTTARRSRAQQGHGEGIGAPGKAEARRESRGKAKKAGGQTKEKKAAAQAKPAKARR